MSTDWDISNTSNTVEVQWGQGGDTHTFNDNFAPASNGFDNLENTNGGEFNNMNGGDGDRACYNCGQPGHNKADCTAPRVFTGECRGCGQTG